MLLSWIANTSMLTDDDKMSRLLAPSPDANAWGYRLRFAKLDEKSQSVWGIA
jgi:hypothetical protein